MQLSAYSARELRLLNLSSLTMALQNDPDLGRLNSSTDLPKILQSIFVCARCDYITGKATFMRYFYQHAAFITGEIDYSPGSLSDVSLVDNKWKTGFLAFLRLITSYLKKTPSSGFDIQSPILLFSKFSEENSIKEQHYEWINHIRQTSKMKCLHLIMRHLCFIGKGLVGLCICGVRLTKTKL